MSEMKSAIRADMKEAMKAKDTQRLGAIRMLLAAIQAEETSGTKHEITDEEVTAVVAREIKKRRESAEIYASNGREDLAEQERAEIAVLESYQPEQLDDAALTALVEECAADIAEAQGLEMGELSMRQMGALMKEASARAQGAVEGKRLSEEVKRRLQG